MRLNLARMGRLPFGLHRRGMLPALLLAGAAACANLPTHAAVQLDRTRVVVTQANARATVNASNADQRPVLLQVWVEPGANNGGIAATPYGTTPAATPFLLDPPVLLLQARETRALQVWMTEAPETLPKDRESQFWLNVLEVPAQEHTDGDAQTPQNSRLDINILTKIKVFYRPQALHDYVPHSSADRLQFALERNAHQPVLTIRNPAPIHQSLDSLILHQGEKDTPVALDAVMLVPFGNVQIPLPSNIPATAEKLWIKSATLDDNGNLIADAQDF